MREEIDQGSNTTKLGLEDAGCRAESGPAFFAVGGMSLLDTIRVDRLECCVGSELKRMNEPVYLAQRSMYVQDCLGTCWFPVSMHKVKGSFKLYSFICLHMFLYLFAHVNHVIYQNADNTAQVLGEE